MADKTKTTASTSIDWTSEVNRVMKDFVGSPINRDALSSLLSEIQLATPGLATLLPSNFGSGEVRVQVVFREYRIIATICGCSV